MKKLSIVAAITLGAGLASCRTVCPAYTQQAAPQPLSSTVTASAAQPSAGHL